MARLISSRMCVSHQQHGWSSMRTRLHTTPCHTYMAMGLGYRHCQGQGQGCVRVRPAVGLGVRACVSCRREDVQQHLGQGQGGTSKIRVKAAVRARVRVTLRIRGVVRAGVRLRGRVGITRPMQYHLTLTLIHTLTRTLPGTLTSAMQYQGPRSWKYNTHTFGQFRVTMTTTRAPGPAGWN